MKNKIDIKALFKSKKFLSPFIAVCIFIFALLLDLLTKEFVISKCIPEVGDKMDVMPGFINFIYVRNQGAAWGIFSSVPWLLIVFTVVVLSLFITYYILKLRKDGNNISITLTVSVGLIAGGAIGNLVDRIFLGYVRDFINFQFMNFPVFNFADIMLTVGVIVMIVYFLFLYPKEGKNKENKEEKHD